MKITEIHIDRWRNLENVHLNVPADTNLISLVGSNGTGKTNLLELLSFAAARFGLAAGVRPQPREFPPQDSAFHVVLTVAEDVEIDPAVLEAHAGNGAGELFASWDRTLTLWRFAYVPADPPPGFPPAYAGEAVLAGGVLAERAHGFGNGIVQSIQQGLELNHLFLDAERSYGPVAVRDDQILAASREDIEEPGRRRQRAILATVSMYEEWILDSLGREHRHDAEFAHAHREAAAQGEAGPDWDDPWTEYRRAVSSILPHLSFSRPDQTRKTLIFNAGGHEVSYHELSGGEREVAFLIGQLLRFRLERGLLLLDEPELHLNAELLERWLTWANDSVTGGQVWIATHSLEAVEVAGPDNALVLERDSDGLVRRINRLSDRPIMSTLSGALGAPAFSLDRQRFILIEGGRPGPERARFSALCPGSENLFLEAGNCKQVIEKLELVAGLAEESDRLHIGGVIDRDQWDIRQRRRFEEQAPVHLLEVHEVENFFLIPDALALLAERNGGMPDSASQSLIGAADRFAGLWIAERAAVRHDTDLGPALRSRVGNLTWAQIDRDREQIVAELSVLADLGDPDIRPQVHGWLIRAVEQYAEIRDSDTLWAECAGKQVIGPVAHALGLDGAAAIERQVLKLLAEEEIEAPEALLNLRQYVTSLSAAAVTSLTDSS